MNEVITKNPNIPRRQPTLSHIPMSNESSLIGFYGYYAPAYSYSLIAIAIKLYLKGEIY